MVDWLTQVQHHLKLSEETLYRTVIILDTVLWQRFVEPDMLQLVGITAMLLASKLEEYYPVELAKLIHLTENSYRARQVLDMEKTILVALDFKVGFPQVPGDNLHSQYLVFLSSSRPALRPSSLASPGPR